MLLITMTSHPFSSELCYSKVNGSNWKKRKAFWRAWNCDLSGILSLQELDAFQENCPLLWEADGRRVFYTSPALSPAALAALSSWHTKTWAQDLGTSILNVKEKEGGVHVGSETWRRRNCRWWCHNQCIQWLLIQRHKGWVHLCHEPAKDLWTKMVSEWTSVSWKTVSLVQVRRKRSSYSIFWLKNRAWLDTGEKLGWYLLSGKVTTEKKC